jgi:hypothetical protein
MKKSIYRSVFYSSLIASVLLTGCDGELRVVKRDPIITYEIDGCEYIKIESGRYGWGSHKGNCKFCAERVKNNCK